jgi:hypothetical protein
MPPLLTQSGATGFDVSKIYGILDIKKYPQCGCCDERRHAATHGACLNRLSHRLMAGERERPRQTFSSTDSCMRRAAAISPAGNSHRDALKWSSQRKHHSGWHLRWPDRPYVSEVLPTTCHSGETRWRGATCPLTRLAGHFPVVATSTLHDVVPTKHQRCLWQGHTPFPVPCHPESYQNFAHPQQLIGAELWCP